MDFRYTTEQEMYRQAIREWLSKNLEPRARAIDEAEDGIPTDITDGMAELGMFGVTIPEEYGGMPLPDDERLIYAMITVQEIARARADLVSRAREGKLTLPDMEGGTFTISNLGMFGIASFEAVINPPQVAILATDAIRKRPVVIEHADGDAIAIHPVGMLTLTWDHRAFDGAYAASFLHAVAEIIETRDWEAELR